MNEIKDAFHFPKRSPERGKTESEIQPAGNNAEVEAEGLRPLGGRLPHGG
jgi:hypothetical protein